jgi:Dirigent-like protein
VDFHAVGPKPEYHRFVPVGLSVDVGWQWWLITTIAAAVTLSGVVVFAVSRNAAVGGVAGLFALEGAAIAVVAPFVMTDTSPAAAGGGMRADPSTTVIHVIEHAPPPHMQTIGPMTTFANPVFDTSDTKRVGRDQGFCVRIAIAKGAECVFTTLLPGGQITAEGPESENENLTFPAAITGGTGKYKHARGWSTETARNKAATKFDLVFHVTD